MSQQATYVEIEGSRNAERLVAELGRVLKRSRGPLVDRFGDETAAVMRKEILEEYRRLIPEIPDIGGRRNIYSRDLTASAWFLAIYRVVARHGGSVDAAGEAFHHMVRLELGRMPRLIRPLVRNYRFSRPRIKRLQRAARRSQDRRYPGDWVFEVIDGEDKPFDFGIDMIECGIVKFFHDQGADELVPHLCDLDYIGAEIMGVGLQRTKTLAWGCDRCDFRMTKNGTTSAVWPPRFVEQTCGESDGEP